MNFPVTAVYTVVKKCLLLLQRNLVKFLASMFVGTKELERNLCPNLDFLAIHTHAEHTHIHINKK